MENSEKPRVFFETHGCRSNYADTVDLQHSLAEKGAIVGEGRARLNSSEQEVDVFVLNTCTVTNEADREALRSIRKIRDKHPQAKIVVTGCMAEVRAKKLQSIEGVSTVLGPGQKEKLINSILGVEDSNSRDELTNLPSVYPSGRRVKKSLPQFKSISLDKELSTAAAGPAEHVGEVKRRSRYPLRVQEGCENSCTFCIIPQTRGRFSSRPLELILDDIEKLYELGYREVILTGTHLGGYGIDSGGSFENLLQAVQSKVSGINRARDESNLRIRLSSIDPEDVSPALIDFIAESPEFCKHIHICVQAFNESILKLMNRRHSLQDALDVIDYAKQKIPGICLGTDVITGFPGEGTDEFLQGLEIIEGLPLAYLHVFPYSERSKTAATRLGGEVEVNERRKRAVRLRALSKRLRESYYRQFVGEKLDLVVEAVTENELRATSSEYISVKCEISTRTNIVGSNVAGSNRANKNTKNIKDLVLSGKNNSEARINETFFSGQRITATGKQIDGDFLRCEL